MQNITWPEAIVAIVVVLVFAEIFGDAVSSVVAAFKTKYVCPCECHNMEEEE